MDVKTTEYEFERCVIISKNEIKFITEKKPKDYAIFRVYSFRELQAKLRVCSECLKYIKKLYRDIDYMTQSMSDYKAAMINYKIAFEPGPYSFNSISDEISVSYQKNNEQFIDAQNHKIVAYQQNQETGDVLMAAQSIEYGGEAD